MEGEAEPLEAVRTQAGAWVRDARREIFSESAKLSSYHVMNSLAADHQRTIVAIVHLRPGIDA